MVGNTLINESLSEEGRQMAQVVAHVRKIKTVAGVGNVVAHNSRIKVYDEKGEIIQSRQAAGAWFNPEWGKFNRIDPLIRDDPAPRGPLSAVYAQRDRIIDRAREETEKAGGKWRKPSKSAAAAVEIILSFSPGWQGQDGWSDSKPAKDKIDQFMAKGRKWLQEKYGFSILHMAEHWDEKTPHLHAVVVPVTKNIRPPRNLADGKVKTYDPLKPGAWRYSSGDFFGGPAGLIKFQDEIAAVMKPLGLERGTVKSRAKHTNLSHHAAEIEALEKQIVEKRQELDGMKKEVAVIVKSKKERLRGWELPQPKALESAKHYRERIAPDVMGKVMRALETVDTNAVKTRNAQEKASESVDMARYEVDRSEKLRRQAEQERDASRARFNELKTAVLETSSLEGLTRLKVGLHPPRSRSQEHGREF
jgi:hypothetical protein